MKILKLSNMSGCATVALDLDDLERMTQLFQVAALAVVGTELPPHLDSRDDLRTLADAYAGMLELAAMIAAGSRGGLADYRQMVARLDFPHTQEGQGVAREAKQVDDLLSSVDLEGGNHD